MKAFMDADFLLETDTARHLYHDYAEHLPILDYHCHIPPQEICDDRRFENITQVWLGGDHYKWRVMRSNGVPEAYITGDRPDREKFQKFAEALPRAVGNPMYHWCHLELKTYFGYEGILNGKTAEEVWNLCNEKLQNDPACTVRGLIQHSNVEMIGTTDDPIDDLQAHRRLAGDPEVHVKVLPSFRPDKALNIYKPGFVEYIGKLGETVGRKLACVQDVADALCERISYFHENGCRAADHGLDYVMYREDTMADMDALFSRAMRGEAVTAEQAEGYITYLQQACAREYHRRGIVWQIHYSCMRCPNSRMFEKLGADTGFDTVAVTLSGRALAALLDSLDRTEELPKTVIYSLNPGDNALIGSIIGAFQGDIVPGKVQQGSGWWFNDNKTGMEEQMTSLANLGLLGNFIGMLTDSRSFLSYTRHAYFRRILCNLLGKWVENGEFPNDEETLKTLTQDICYENAKRYFGL